MIVVKVELWPYGHESEAKELSRMYIANTGGTKDRGNYKVAVMRKGSVNPPWPHSGHLGEIAKPIRSCDVENHPRLSAHVLVLVQTALNKMFGPSKE